MPYDAIDSVYHFIFALDSVVNFTYYYMVIILHIINIITNYTNYKRSNIYMKLPIYKVPRKKYVKNKKKINKN